MELPDEYLAFMHSGKPQMGLSDLTGDRENFVLWEIDHVNQVNKNLGIQEFYPGFLTFGANQSGQLYAFDSDGAVYVLPTSGVASTTVTKVADGWDDFEKHIIPI